MRKHTKLVSPLGSKSEKKRLTLLDLKEEVVSLWNWRQVSGWSTDSVDGLLSNCSSNRSTSSADSHTSSQPSTISEENDELKLNTADRKSGPQIVRCLGVNKTVPIYDTKLAHCLSIDFCIYLSLAEDELLTTRERSQVHRRWAACFRSNAILQWSSDQG